MNKIERKFMAHYINVAEKDAPQFERLGKDLEEYSPELSAQVETKRNILGEMSVVISGYEKTGAVETYYAEPGSMLFERLQSIVDDDLVLEELKTQVVDVKLWTGNEDNFEAVCEDAYIEVVSYGGDTSGYQIPFKLHFTGEKQKGSFDISAKTFTEA